MNDWYTDNDPRDFGRITIFHVMKPEEEYPQNVIARLAEVRPSAEQWRLARLLARAEDLYNALAAMASAASLEDRRTAMQFALLVLAAAKDQPKV